ncbi:hypothetical protein BH18ACT15_BH18ACT15_12640 [soil metagenome]
MTYGLLGYFAYLETVLGPLMPFLRAERHLSYTVAGLHFAAFSLGGVVVGLVGERAVRLCGRWTALWGGGAGMGIGAALLAASSSAVGTLSGALIMGLCGSMLLITTQVVLADRHREWTAVAITESNVAASVCAILASVAVGALASTVLGWRTALVLPVAVFVLLAGLFREEPLGRATSTEPSHQEAPRALPGSFWAYCCVLFLGVAVEWCMAYWAADFLDNELGMDPSAAAGGLSLLFVGMLAGRIAGSRLARTHKAERLLFLTLCLALAGFPAFWLSSSPAMSLLGLLVVGLGIGNAYPLTISLGMASAWPRANTATARLALAGASAILIAPFALGALADHVGIELAYGLVIPFLLSAAALALIESRLRQSE